MLVFLPVDEDSLAFRVCLYYGLFVVLLEVMVPLIFQRRVHLVLPRLRLQAPVLTNDAFLQRKQRLEGKIRTLQRALANQQSTQKLIIGVVKMQSSIKKHLGRKKVTESEEQANSTSTATTDAITTVSRRSQRRDSASKRNVDDVTNAIGSRQPTAAPVKDDEQGGQKNPEESQSQPQHAIVKPPTFVVPQQCISTAVDTEHPTKAIPMKTQIPTLTRTNLHSRFVEHDAMDAVSSIRSLIGNRPRQTTAGAIQQRQKLPQPSNGLSLIRPPQQIILPRQRAAPSQPSQAAQQPQSHVLPSRQEQEKRSHEQAFGIQNVPQCEREKTPRIARRIAFDEEMMALSEESSWVPPRQGSHEKRKLSVAFTDMEEDDTPAFRRHKRY